MNFLAKSIINVVRPCLAKSIEGSKLQLARLCAPSIAQGNPQTRPNICIGSLIQGVSQIRLGSSFAQIHRRRKEKKVYKSKNPLDGKPFAKGIVLKTLIRKPKKPNSANRKCVLVRLSTGKEMVAYVPGVGHNLQEHNIVLCRPGRVKDTPGVKIRCVRGAYDLPHPSKTTI